MASEAKVTEAVRDTSHFLTQYRGGFERISPYGHRVLRSIERMVKAGGAVPGRFDNRTWAGLDKVGVPS